MKNRAHCTSGIGAVGITTVLALAACATPATTGGTPANLAQRVEQASTPADHAALADYFEARAAAEEQLAHDCRSLRDRFGKAAALPEVRDHYHHLMESHRRNAGDYRALARLHRRAAQAARQPQADD